MSNAIEHTGDRQEPGGEERSRVCRAYSRDRNDPDTEPGQIESHEKRERHFWQAKHGPEALMKTGRRFLGEVDGLNSGSKGERS